MRTYFAILEKMMMKLIAEQLQSMLDHVHMQATRYEIGEMTFQHAVSLAKELILILVS